MDSKGKCINFYSATPGSNNVAVNDDEIEVKPAPLPEPRPLAGEERELLEFLLSGPVDSPELRAQAEMAMVWAVCSCGCASINLRVADDAPRATLTGPEVLPNGAAEISATGMNEDGEEMDVTLHVWSPNEGYYVRKGGAVLAEIEVWPTLAIGDSTYGYKKPPAISALRFSTHKWMI